MNFSDALNAVKTGSKIARAGWNGKGMFVVAICGDAVKEGIHNCYGDPSKDGLDVKPFMVIKGTDHELATWVPSIGDLFAEDWEVVDGSN